MEQNKVIFPCSHWGSNIGNAFFHFGNRYLLEEVSSLKIEYADLRSEKAFMQTSKQMKFDSMYHQNVEGAEYLLLDGPMFDENFDHLFGGMLKRASDAGVKIILMSAGGINYNKEEEYHCKKVLEKYKPYIFTSRDRDTYETYKDFAEKSYDGLCGAWFCPDFYEGFSTPSFNNYMSVCFDHAIEPEISLGQFDINKPETWSEVGVSKVNHRKIDKLLRLMKRGGYMESIDGMDVIRPTHQVLHRANWRLFFKENTFASQTPWGYLNIYKNTNLTVTDRLHAAVATLAFGNPARLIIKSNRAKLLNRVNAEGVGDKVIKLDMDYLSGEKAAYKEWLRAAINVE
jgi:hypothetical protein